MRKKHSYEDRLRYMTIFDTVRVMFMRILQGKSPFHPDKTHLHHVFVRMGVSHSITALIEIMLNLMIAGAWGVLVRCDASVDRQLYWVILFSMLLVWGTYFFFLWHEKHHTEFLHHIVRFGIKTHLGYTSWWQRLAYWLDYPEIKHADASETARELSENIAFKERIDQDRQHVLDFLKGKAEVFVDDIKKRSEARPENVEALVREGLANGTIRQIKAGVWGVPLIVALEEEIKTNKSKQQAAVEENS